MVGSEAIKCKDTLLATDYFLSRGVRFQFVFVDEEDSKAGMRCNFLSRNTGNRLSTLSSLSPLPQKAEPRT